MKSRCRKPASSSSARPNSTTLPDRWHLRRWNGGRKGLLSGEVLHLDLTRMELAYHDHNRREYELTKNISPVTAQSVGPNLGAVRQSALFARATNDVVISAQPDGQGAADTLVADGSLGGVRGGQLANTGSALPADSLSLYLNDNSMESLWLAVTWAAN